MAAPIEVGRKAPAFSLQDQDGRTHRLKDYEGRPLVLYFYPKDDTPGCTRRACAFRDSLSDLGKTKAAVLGVSVLDVASKAKFAKKHGLTFPLLAGPGPRGRGQVRRVEEEEPVRQDLHGRGAHDLPDRAGRQGHAPLGRRQGGRPRERRARGRPRTLTRFTPGGGHDQSR